MNWLRLKALEGGDAKEVRDGDGKLVEIVIPCRSKGDPRLPAHGCCIDPRLKKNGTKTIRVRDRRLEPAPTWLEIKRQRFKCDSCDGTVYEILPDVADDHMVTNRLKVEIATAAIKRPFSDVASIQAVEETLVRRIFKEHAKRELAEFSYQAPRVLGVDENTLLGSQRFVMVDIEKGQLLDLVPSRSPDIVEEHLERMEDLHRVEVFCQDMWHPYRQIAARRFPSALVVIDKFHIVRLANDALDTVRYQIQKNLPAGQRKEWAGRRRLLLKRWDALDRAGQDRVAEFVACDQRLKDAYTWKEKFFDIYEMDSRSKAEAAFQRWVADMPLSVRREFNSIARTMSTWSPYVFNYFDARYTSGVVENLNGLLNRINSGGYGYSFETLRAKALLRYGSFSEKVNLGMFFLDAFTSFDDPPPVLDQGIPISTFNADLEQGLF